jgi:hypothetical protein
MSRADKDGLVDLAADLGATGTANAEKLSGADLAQVLLTVKNGDSAAIDSDGDKTLGVNAAFPGNPNSAALSGADLERFAGSQ